MNTIKPEKTTIGEIVSSNYHAAGVFKKAGIDFCCGGGITLEKACAKKGLNPDEIVTILNALLQASVDQNSNYNAWSPDYLINHIIDTHHNFVRDKTSEIISYAGKVARVHGERNPENVAIYQRFLTLSREMLDHLKSEEERLFPLIKQIYQARMSGKPVSEDDINALRNELDQMEDEHEAAGDLMKEIRALSNDYTPPADACRTYQILYKNLEGFEADLHKHVHLENNILFKKAEQLV